MALQVEKEGEKTPRESYDAASPSSHSAQLVGGV